MARITLITDFGTVDGYVGVLKGVMASLAPQLFLDDVTHDIPPGDVEKASRVLSRVWSRFPPGTVHLVVVDPGVGTDRRGLALEAGGHFFVAPDNGVLSSVLSQFPAWKAVALSASPLLPPPESRTFHGRDIFAPAAALLASGTPLEELGPEVSDPVHLGGFVPGAEGEEGEGWVVEVDRFGNLALDLPVDLVRRAGGVEVQGRDLPLVGSYGEGEPGELLALVNSDGLVEIAVRDGSAAERLKVGVGELIAVQPLLVLYGETPLSRSPVNELQDHPSHEHDGGHLEEKK